MELKRVLVVDDEAGLARANARNLQHAGFAVDIALSVEEAMILIQAARSGDRGPQYAAIVTDLHMPGLSGADLIRWVRQQRIGASVILLSALATDIEVAAIGGLSAFLRKPCERQALIAAVRSAVHASAA